jgi:hypothetical protein
VRMEGGPKKVDADLHGGVHHHVGASPVKAAEVVAADADDGDVEIYDLIGGHNSVPPFYTTLTAILWIAHSTPPL